MTAENHTWEQLSLAASHEHDPKRLLALVSELMKALDDRKESVREPIGS